MTKNTKPQPLAERFFYSHGQRQARMDKKRCPLYINGKMFTEHAVDGKPAGLWKNYCLVAERVDGVLTMINKPWHDNDK